MDYTRTVTVAGRSFRLAPLTDEQAVALFFSPSEQLTVWQQYVEAVFCSLENGGTPRAHVSLEDLTVLELHTLLRAISQIHNGIPSFEMVDSQTRLLLAETSPLIQ